VHQKLVTRTSILQLDKTIRLRAYNYNLKLQIWMYKPHVNNMNGTKIDNHPTDPLEYSLQIQPDNKNGDFILVLSTHLQ
jgi:hypothetical protein